MNKQEAQQKMLEAQVDADSARKAASEGMIAVKEAQSNLTKAEKAESWLMHQSTSANQRLKEATEAWRNARE